jgi:hypothetical protein
MTSATHRTGVQYLGRTSSSAVIKPRSWGVLLAWVAACFMLVGLLAGCDGSDDSGTNKVTVTLDAAGGTVTGPDGVQVVVPQGR